MIKVTKFTANGPVDIPCKVWKFPTGEIGFKFTDISLIIKGQSKYEINCKFESNDDIFAAIQAVDALKNLNVNSESIILFLPYLPYSRQDRICHEGEAFSLGLFAQILNSLGVTICTLDVHSEVAFGQIPMLENATQYECAWYLPKFGTLIAPDKGAKLKAKQHAQVNGYSFDKTEIVCLEKQRIGSSIVYMDYEFDAIKGTACIVDDLCDGGGTFLACADMLRRTQPNLTELSLYITHGFFTAGIDKLKEKFNNIYVCNLMSKDTDVINFVKEI